MSRKNFKILQFVASPTNGMSHGSFNRKGDEVARSTTVFRFESNTKFPYHQYGGGEEFLVRKRTFIDNE
ncbi:hypothetical protein HK100_000941, partial [Physocladia obscura]